MHDRFSKKLLKPKEIAEKAGVLTSKIAFYTSIGIISPAHLSEGGQKLYDEDDVLLQMSRIKKLTDKGLSLDEIKEKIGFNRNSRRLMIIDDEQEVVDLIIDVLKDKYNFDIVVARDGFEAGRLIGSNFPDIIILDLNLPGINGFELCRIIREDELQKGVKILAVTGYYNEENVKKIMDYSADAVMAKPFDVGDFTDKVFKLLSIKKSRAKNIFLGEAADETK